jgi:hypothetical protein
MTKTEKSEIARALAALRKHKRGGRAPSCTCGECAKCKNRATVRRFRKRQAAGTA